MAERNKPTSTEAGERLVSQLLSEHFGNERAPDLTNSVLSRQILSRSQPDAMPEELAPEEVSAIESELAAASSRRPSRWRLLSGGRRRLERAVIAAGVAGLLVAGGLIMLHHGGPKNDLPSPIVDLPDGYRAASGAKLTVASDAMELERGLLLIDRSEQPLASGRDWVYAGAAKTLVMGAGEINEYLPERLRELADIRSEDLNLAREQANWLIEGGFAILVLDGVALVNGRAVAPRQASGRLQIITNGGQDFAERDSNRDGFLSGDEVDLTLLEDLDTDQDGRLSPQEYSAKKVLQIVDMRTSEEQATRPTGFPPELYRTPNGDLTMFTHWSTASSRLFHALDRNDDQYIDATEMPAGAVNLADTDQDAKVSKIEFLAACSSKPNDQGVAPIDQLFAALDVLGRGKLGVSELGEAAFKVISGKQQMELSLEEFRQRCEASSFTGPLSIIKDKDESTDNEVRVSLQFPSTDKAVYRDNMMAAILKWKEARKLAEGDKIVYQRYREASAAQLLQEKERIEKLRIKWQAQEVEETEEKPRDQKK